MENILQPALPISAVERETGLSKEVLRKWESRYGFPSPLRDAQGERSYPPEQVSRLRLIKRLMDTGLRPSRLVAESEEGLHALAREKQPSPRAPGGDEDRALTLDSLRDVDPVGLRLCIYRVLLRQGVERFVQDTLHPLCQEVGDAWARGELGIHEEHLLSEALQSVLREVVAQLADSRGSPRVLLTTLPEEQHGLGILAAAALLALRGACCIPLGTQTPILDIVRAARDHRADVVALSFSVVYPQRRIPGALAELRQSLGAATELWCGGAGCARVAAPAADIRVLPAMTDTLAALAEWQQRHVIATT